MILVATCLTNWEKPSQSDQPQEQNKYTLQPRSLIVSWSIRSGQYGFFAADMALVCFDNIPHCGPLPGYVPPYSPLGHLERYKDGGTMHVCYYYLKPTRPLANT